MANAIKKISVQRGYDVTPLCAELLRRRRRPARLPRRRALGMTEVLIHPFSSLLSAYGMGLADIRATRQQAIEENLGPKALAAIKREGGRLGKDAKAEVAGQGVPPAKIKVIVRGHVRYGRHRHDPLVVEAGSLAKMKSAFEKAHKARFGFIDRAKQLVVEAVSVEAVGGVRQIQASASTRPRERSSPPRFTHAILLEREMEQGRQSTPAHSFAPGHKVKGPAIIIEPHQTIVLERRLARRDHRQEPSRAQAGRGPCNAPRRSAPRPIRS